MIGTAVTTSRYVTRHAKHRDQPETRWVAAKAGRKQACGGCAVPSLRCNLRCSNDVHRQQVQSILTISVHQWLGNGIEGCLDKVFQVARLSKDRHLLSEPRGPWLLSLERGCCLLPRTAETVFSAYSYVNCCAARIFRRYRTLSTVPCCKGVLWTTHGGWDVRVRGWKQNTCCREEKGEKRKKRDTFSNCNVNHSTPRARFSYTQQRGILPSAQPLCFLLFFYCWLVGRPNLNFFHGRKSRDI